MSRMAPRTAPLHLRYAESSTPAGSAIAAINAHSGRCVVRHSAARSSPHRPLGVLFFVFAGPVACSSRQRPRCAQPLARRRMTAQRFCRLLTLPALISAIFEPVLRSVIGSAPAPLRGSWRQQPRGAAVPAAMIAPCADEVLRAAVVDRTPPCHRDRRGGWLVTCGVAKLRHTAPTHPARSRRDSLRSPPLPCPPQNEQSCDATLAAITPKKNIPSLALIGTGIKKTMPEQPTLSEIQCQ